MGAENIRGLFLLIVISIREAVYLNFSGDTVKCKPYANRPHTPMRVRVTWVRKTPPVAETPIGTGFFGISKAFPIFIHLYPSAGTISTRNGKEYEPSFL